MFCTKCGSKIALSENFCKVCGAKVTAQCPQCGNRLENNEKFCTNCGTQISAQVAQKATTSTPVVKSSALQSTAIANDFFKEREKFVWANVILLALSLILAFTKVIVISVSLWVVDYSEGIPLTSWETNEEYWNIHPFTFILAYLAAIICIVLPLRSTTKKDFSPAIFIPAKIATILSFCCFLMLMVKTCIYISDDYFEALESINLSSSGWLYLFSTIGALVLAFKNAKDLKQRQFESTITKAMSQQR